MLATERLRVANGVLRGDPDCPELLIDGAGSRLAFPVVSVSVSDLPDSLVRWEDALAGTSWAQLRVLAEMPVQPFIGFAGDGADLVLWCLAGNAHSLPPECRWAPLRDELIDALDPDRATVVEDIAVATFAVTRTPGDRAAEAFAWAGELLGGEPRGNWRLCRTRPYSAIYERSTRDGGAILKLASEHFNNDGALIARLPDLPSVGLPAVIGSDGPGNASLLARADGELLDQCTELDDWTTAIRAFDDLQVALAEPQVRSRLEAHLRIPSHEPISKVDVEELACQSRPWSDSADRALVNDAGERLAEAATEFDRFALPATLDHGDLHAANVIRGRDARGLEKKPVFLDWTDAGVAPPLLWLATAFASHRGTMAGRARDLLRPSVERWLGDSRPCEDVIRIAFIVGALHQARHYRWIAEAMGPLAGAQFASGVGFWLREAARATSMQGPAA